MCVHAHARKQDLPLNNLQGLICHKTQSALLLPNLSLSLSLSFALSLSLFIYIYIYITDKVFGTTWIFFSLNIKNE